MKRLAFVLPVAVLGCTQPQLANRVLEDAGYTHIQTGGYAFAACAESDTYATRFTAIGPTGRQVSGAVCAGVFKGATIRLD